MCGGVNNGIGLGAAQATHTCVMGHTSSPGGAAAAVAGAGEVGLAGVGLAVVAEGGGKGEGLGMGGTCQDGGDGALGVCGCGRWWGGWG